MPQPDAVNLDLSQYCGVWAIEESSFALQLDRVRSLDLSAHLAANGGRNVAAASMSRAGSVAVIDIVGTMTKRGSSMSAAGSTVMIRDAIRAAANDPDVLGILLKIDSPGGTVAGTADLGAEVARAKASKPVYVYGEDLVASAAYWVASQGDKVYANSATSQWGSIGTYFAIDDLSRAASNAGIETIVIRSAPLKGAGVPGDKITEEQRAVWQEMVDGMQEQFSAAVAAGRGFSKEQIAAVATGRVYRASEAKKLGLIDGIKSFDETLAELSKVALQRKKASRKMEAASYDEIVQACDGIDPSSAEDALFATDQLRRKATADEARKAWGQTQRQRIDAARQEAKEAKDAAARAAADAEAKAAEAAEKARVEAAKVAPKLQGTDPLLDKGRGKGAASDESYTGDAAADFDAAVRERMKAGGERRKAVVAVAKANPEMHQAYLLATNPKKVHGKIRDRFSGE